MTQPGGAPPHGVAWSVTLGTSLCPTAPKVTHSIKKEAECQAASSIFAGVNAVWRSWWMQLLCKDTQREREGEREREIWGGAYICKRLTHQCWQNESCDDREDGAAYGIVQFSQHFLALARQLEPPNNIATNYRGMERVHARWETDCGSAGLARDCLNKIRERGRRRRRRRGKRGN